MVYIWGISFFLFGAAVGSFILVIADRYGTDLPFFKGRSFCFSCREVIQKRDLIPVFSFLFLHGRCRHCRSTIPISVFIVEIFMGILSVLAAFKSGFLGLEFGIWNLKFLFDYLILTSIFAVVLLISVYDLRHFIIPDAFLLLLFVFALLHNSYFIILNSETLSSKLLALILSGLGLAIPFLLIFMISRGRWLGFGDVKYIAVIGFLLGLGRGLSAVVFSFWVGAVVSLSLIFLKKTSPSLPWLPNDLTIKSEIPFGPFLSLGVIAGLLLDLDLLPITFLINVF